MHDVGVQGRCHAVDRCHPCAHPGIGPDLLNGGGQVGEEAVGDPLWVVAFAAEDGLDVYQVMENMGHRGWSLNGLQRPAAVHIAVTLRHTQPGVAGRFLADLAESVEEVRANPGVSTGMAPIYGMAGALDAEVVHQLLAGYLDMLFEV